MMFSSLFSRLFCEELSMLLTRHLDANATLVSLIQPLTTRDGFTPTTLPGVQILRASCDLARGPQIYEPSLVIIAQGSKLAYLGSRTLEYGAGHYLIQALPVPFECETFSAPDGPMLGISIAIDRVLLGELVLAMGLASGRCIAAQTPESMTSAVLDDAMRGCVERLLRCLHDPLESQVMGRARLRELLFVALRGPQADVLRALVEQQGQFARIAASLSHLHAHYTEPLNVEALASCANMSASTFHEHFKRCTLLSPVQYLKRLRLLKAQRLLQGEGLGVAQVAHRVGYQSTSQFSREYKRYFERNPGDERAA
jgi:AraC-like DNA-binding protein